MPQIQVVRKNPAVIDELRVDHWRRDVTRIVQPVVEADRFIELVGFADARGAAVVEVVLGSGSAVGGGSTGLAAIDSSAVALVDFGSEVFGSVAWVVPSLT